MKRWAEGFWKWVNRYSTYITAIILVIIIALFVFAINLDIVYWGYAQHSWADMVINNFRGLRMYNITYTGALKIISSSAGILLTIITLFLNMNLNIMQRKETKVCGISRNELYQSKKSVPYFLMKLTSYLALLIMMIFLNLSFCVSAYLLLTYNYLFLLWNYFIHLSSFSKERDRDILVDKLVECVNKDDDFNKNVIEYQLLLEMMIIDINKNARWKEAECLFDCLLDKSCEMGEKEHFAICTLYCEKIYWSDERYYGTGIQLLKDYIVGFEERAVKDIGILEQEYTIFWGMLNSMVKVITEEYLVELLSWYLNINKRSIYIYQKTKIRLLQDVLDAEHEMWLIAVELYLQKHHVMTDKMGNLINKLGSYCKDIYLIEKNKFGKKIAEFLYQIDEREASLLKDIDAEIEKDYRNNWKHTHIASIMQVVQGR